jgi:hypothetical protein
MEHLKNLVMYFRGKGLNVPKATEDLFAHIEETLLPHLLRVFQKDNTLFTGEGHVTLIPGVDISGIWTGDDEGWKVVHMALLYSVLHGDPKEKFGKIIDTIKTIVPGLGGGRSTDEIMKVLEEEGTQSSLKDMLDLVMNTRLASIIGDIVQSIKFDDLDIDLENPEQLLYMLENPAASPVLTKLTERAQAALEERIKSGKINQQELIREVEMIRARFQSEFGRYLNEMVVGPGGNTTGNTAAQIMSNSPDARRARMLARLQRKQREKTHR